MIPGNNSNTYKLTAKTFFGLEEILAAELKTLGAKSINIQRRAVDFEGDKELLYKANYFCRTALRILLNIGTFRVKDAKSLYRYVYNMDWASIISPDNTMAVDSVVHSEVFDHSGYVALKVKDAIVDQIRNAKNRRPDINPNHPDFLVHVHVNGNDCSISLDSSGESLHRRGYRLDGSIAPLNEALAAGMIMLTGWKGECNFVDFMCGSGTILIEAAMIAHNIPAGAYRKEFGFEKWNDYDDELFQKIKDSYDETEFHKLITGCDVSKNAFYNAQRNIKNTYLHKRIEIKNYSFENLTPPTAPGIVITNPPYGERLSMDDLNTFYKTIGNKLKRDFAGYTAWIISSNTEATKFIGLHPAQKIKLYNGNLECKFLKYEIYDGSKKK